MLVKILNTKLYIPDSLIDHYAEDFSVLQRIRHRDSLMDIREQIVEIFEIAAEDPEVMYDEDYLEDIIEALAMRQALIELKMMYDA